MSFSASTFLLPYNGSDRVLSIQTTNSVKVGGFNVCQYVKSATEQKELMIITSLGTIILDFPTEAEAKTAQTQLQIAVEALAVNCTFVPALSLEYYKESLNSPVTPNVVQGTSSLAVGEGNTISVGSDQVYSFGQSLAITNCTDLIAIGFNLTTTGKSNLVTIGQNDFTLDIDTNGWLYSLPTFNTTTYGTTPSMLAIDDNGKIFNTGLDPFALTPVIGLNEIAFGDNITGALTSSSTFVNVGGQIGLGTASPAYDLDINGNDFTTLRVKATDYASIDIISNTLPKIRFSNSTLSSFPLEIWGGISGAATLKIESALEFRNQSNNIFAAIDNCDTDPMLRFGASTGFISYNPDTRLTIEGTTNSNTTYGLRVINSSAVPMLTTRNDGYVYFGDSSAPWNSYMEFNNGSALFKVNSNTTSHFTYNTSGELYLVGLNGNSGFDLQITSIVSKDQIVLRGTATKRLTLDATGNIDMQLSSNGNLYIGADTIAGVDASARLHVRGIDSSNLNYAFIVEDGSTNPIMHIQNDGLIGIYTASPTEAIHINNGTIRIVNGNQASGYLATSDANGVLDWTSPSSLGFALKYSETLIAPAGATPYTITHNLNTTDIHVQLWLESTDELTDATITSRTANSVNVQFSVAPGENVRVIVIG